MLQLSIPHQRQLLLRFLEVNLKGLHSLLRRTELLSLMSSLPAVVTCLFHPFVLFVLRIFYL